MLWFSFAASQIFLIFFFHHSTDQSHPDANVNDINLDGMTPLHVAAKMGLSLVVWAGGKSDTWRRDDCDNCGISWGTFL